MMGRWGTGASWRNGSGRVIYGHRRGRSTRSLRSSASPRAASASGSATSSSTKRRGRHGPAATATEVRGGGGPAGFTSRSRLRSSDSCVKVRVRIGGLSERDLLVAGAALYAGEGAKTDGAVKFANSDPRMIALFFSAWLRRFFSVDESRLRLRLYLHEGLDLESATEFWSALTDIPRSQFGKPYRAVPDLEHSPVQAPYGLPMHPLPSSATHREIMGLVTALLSLRGLQSGVAQLAVQSAVNRKVVGSSPTPGASPAGPVAQWSEQPTHNR